MITPRPPLPRGVGIWLAGSLVYAVAVAQRSSIGVAGPEASERYGVSIAVLSVLPITQLALYALLQVPAGRLLDRFGARLMLALGATTIATGQIMLALTDDLWLACVSRLLVSSGDSVAFVSVLRLVTVGLPRRRSTLFAQLTGVLGQLGAVAAAAPFADLLVRTSWVAAFTLAGLVSLVAAGVAFAFVHEPVTTAAAAPDRVHLPTLWADPGTRLGFWVHFTMTFPTTGFLLYWGLPFLIDRGLGSDAAAYVLSGVSVTGMGVGVVVGILIGRWPNRGFVLCTTFVLVIAATWGTTLLWPDSPAWLPVTTALVTGASAPMGVVAFKYLRPDYATTTSSTATGLVNSGGFIASLLAVAAVAGLGSLMSGLGGAALPAGLAAQFLFWAVGLAMMGRTFRAFRTRVDAHRSVQVPAPRVAE